MNIRAVRTHIFRENEDLVDFIRKAIPKLKNGSVLVVTSKIVALSEGRTAHVRTRKEKEALIKKESTWALQTHPEWWWTEKDGALLVNAGIDDSNADLPRVDSRVKAGGKRVVLLPKDSFKAAALLRKQLRWLYKVKSLGVVITDSRISPMRAGVTGLTPLNARFVRQPLSEDGQSLLEVQGHLEEASAALQTSLLARPAGSP